MKTRGIVFVCFTLLHIEAGHAQPPAPMLLLRSSSDIGQPPDTTSFGYAAAGALAYHLQDFAGVVIKDTSGIAGDTMAIPIEVTNAAGIAGAEIKLTFDPNILTALGVQATDLTSDFMIADTISSGKITIVLARAAGISGGSGDFVNLRFRVNSNAMPGDTTAFAFSRLTFYDENTNAIPVSGFNGLFTVSSGLTSIFILSPDSLFVKTGGTRTFKAEGRDAGGGVITINPTWRVGNEIGSVNPMTGDSTVFTAANEVSSGWVIASQGAIVDSSRVMVRLLCDVSADTVIDVRDVILALRILVGLPLPTLPAGHTIPTPYELWASDADENQTLNSADAYLILLKAIGGLLPKFNVVTSSQGAILHLPRLETSTGKTTALPLVVEQRTDVHAADLILAYDAGDLRVLQILPGDSTSLMVANTQEAGRIRLALISLNGIVNAKGELAIIKLESLKAGEVNLSVEEVNLFDAQARPIAAHVLQGHSRLESIPSNYRLLPNYPNPFNPETMIRYQLPEESHVSLMIYNLTGQLVRTLLNERIKAGDFIRTWDGRNEEGSDAPSGVYFCRMEVNGAEWVGTRKMVLVR